MRPLFLSLLVSLVLLSCKKDKLDAGPFWHCHNSQNWDSTAISNKLAGSWKWKKQYCFWTDKTTSADKNIKLTFDPAGTYTLMENTTVIKQGNWTVKSAGINTWMLDITPTTEYSHGYVLFCNDQLLFNGSGTDGCDYLFDKTN